MVDWLKYQKGSIFMIVRYGISGCIGLVINLVGLFFLTDILHVWYIISSVVSFVVSLLIAFLLQKYWTFRDNDHSKFGAQMVVYTIIALINLGLTTGSLYIAVDKLLMHYFVAALVIYPIMALLSFSANKVFTFGEVAEPCKTNATTPVLNPYEIIDCNTDG